MHGCIIGETDGAANGKEGGVEDGWGEQRGGRLMAGTGKRVLRTDGETDDSNSIMDAGWKLPWKGWVNRIRP